MLSMLALSFASGVSTWNGPLVCDKGEQEPENTEIGHSGSCACIPFDDSAGPSGGSFLRAMKYRLKPYSNKNHW